MHSKRWITGLIALPLVVVLIIGGPVSFWLLLAAVSLLALWEYYQAVFPPAADGQRSWLVWIGMAVAPAILATVHRGGPATAAMWLSIDLVACGMVSVLRQGKAPGGVDAVFRQVFGLLYVPVALSLLIPVRAAADGWQWILFFLFVVFAGDIGAYYVGSYLGRRKLCPAISPGKTVEGAAGGIAANLVVGSLLKIVLLPSCGWLSCLLMIVSIGAVGQMGDLFESQIKRTAGVKDSGSLLPGHGGFLDRIDAILFAAPLAFAFRFFILA